MQEVSTSFRIVPIQELELSQILSALNVVLGPNHDEDWFYWKHKMNPFGESVGWVALDEEGILGVRLLMRWNIKSGDRTMHCFRPVDTITLPRARNRGIFRQLTLFAMDAIFKNQETEMIFNTPNTNSRPGYAKMGWTILPPISHGFQPVTPGRRAAVEYTQSLEAWNGFTYERDKLVTERNHEILHWRYHRKSGVEYGIATLRNSDHPSGIVYRVFNRKGLRILALYELTGVNKEKSILVRSVAVKERAFLVLTARGPGSFNLLPGPAFRRGQSFLAVRCDKKIQPDPLALTSWSLTLGDLERVI
jgi:GNAT acetyltransferase-like protein